MVFLGDGTLLRQSKVTDNYVDSVSIGEHERCDVVVPPDLAEACAAEDGPCSWSAVTNSEVVEEWTCEEVFAVLDG